MKADKITTFADDDIRSDLVVNRLENGSYEIRVAKFRYKNPQDIPRVDPEADPDERVRMIKARHNWLKFQARDRIDARYAGVTLKCVSPEKLLELVGELKRQGYYIPVSVLHHLKITLRKN